MSDINIDPLLWQQLCDEEDQAWNAIDGSMTELLGEDWADRLFDEPTQRDNETDEAFLRRYDKWEEEEL